jgi:hypothetical protein
MVRDLRSMARDNFQLGVGCTWGVREYLLSRRAFELGEDLHTHILGKTPARPA